MKPAKLGGDEKGHKPKLLAGKWIGCETCDAVKRRRGGWWRQCPGPRPKQKYMGE